MKKSFFRSSNAGLRQDSAVIEQWRYSRVADSQAISRAVAMGAGYVDFEQKIFPSSIWLSPTRASAATSAPRPKSVPGSSTPSSPARTPSTSRTCGASSTAGSRSPRRRRLLARLHGDADERRQHRRALRRRDGARRLRANRPLQHLRVGEQNAIEHAMQMMDRYNRLFLRTLRQLRDLRRYSVPITINNPQQVNIAADGGQQLNTVNNGEGES